MRNRPDGARKADFAEIDAIGGKGKTGERRNQRRGDREIGRRLGDAVAAGDVEIDVVRAEAARRNAPRARRAPSTSRAASQPTTARRGVPSGEGATSAWISTSTGRVPSMPAKTAAPGALAWRSPRNSSDGLATSRRPLSDISNTPISSVGPKRFLTARRMRKWWPRFALEIEHGVDHVLDDARAGDLAVLGDVADQHDGRARRLAKRISACAEARTWVTVPGAEFGHVGPQRLDRIDDDQVRPLAVGERGEDVLDIGLGGELAPARRRRPAAARAAGSAPPPLRRRHRRRGGRCRASAAAACISSVDLPMPGSPPTSSAEPRTKPPPVTRSSSPMPVDDARRVLDLARQRGQRHRRGPCAAIAVCRARRRCRRPCLPRRACSTRRRRRTCRPSAVTAPQVWQMNWTRVWPSALPTANGEGIRDPAHPPLRRESGRTEGRDAERARRDCDVTNRLLKPLRQVAAPRRGRRSG